MYKGNSYNTLKIKVILESIHIDGFLAVYSGYKLEYTIFSSLGYAHDIQTKTHAVIYIYNYLLSNIF